MSAQPPYTRAFLVQYRQSFIDEQNATVFNSFISGITNAVLGAAKNGLTNYTIKEVPANTQFQQVIDALKINFPDITIRLIQLPTAEKLKSTPAIYISWV